MVASGYGLRWMEPFKMETYMSTHKNANSKAIIGNLVKTETI